MLDAILTAFIASLLTFARVFLTILIAIIVGLVLSCIVVRSRILETIFLTCVSIFESIPVITFFPVILIIFISNLPGGLGVELAALFLIFTAVAWNIWIAQYESLKSLPKSFEELSKMFNLSFLQKFIKIYIPATIPRTVSNVMISFAVGLFYITVSEVVTISTTTYNVFGIGSYIYNLVVAGKYMESILSMIILLTLVLLITQIFFKSLITWSQKFTYQHYPEARLRRWRFRFPRTYTSPRMSISSIVMNRLTRTLSLNKAKFRKKKLHPHLLRLLKISITLMLIIVPLILYTPYLNIDIFLQNLHLIINDLSRNFIKYFYLLLIDLGRVSIIVLISLVSSTLIVYLMATKPKVEKALLPIIEVLASIPVPAYLPMIAVLMMISLGKILGLRLVLELIVLTSAYLSTAWYVLYNMYSGVKNLPREFWYVCKINKLTFYHKIRKLLIPGAMPAIVTGLISTVGGAWGGLQISEYLIIQDKVYSVPGLVALLSHYITLGDTIRVLSASSVLIIFVIILSIFVWRRLLNSTRSKYRIESSMLY